jgi:putative transcriptional regulator
MIDNIQATDLLIAPPNMPDPRFRDSVMMITYFSESGAHGLCVNKHSGYTLDEILNDSDIRVDNVPPLPVYWGGPVNQNSLWMLHSTDWICDKTVTISDDWAMTSSAEMFERLQNHDLPTHFRLLIGYASWAPGQLDHELLGLGPWKKENSWLTAHNLGPEWLFEQEVDTLWASVVTLSCHQAVDSWL